MVRHTPFSTASLPEVDCTVNFARETLRGDRAAVISIVPLTKEEDWKNFCGEKLLMFNRGLPYSELYDYEEVEREGRGLCSRVFPNTVQTSISTTLFCNQIVGTG